MFPGGAHKQCAGEECVNTVPVVGPELCLACHHRAAAAELRVSLDAKALVADLERTLRLEADLDAWESDHPRPDDVVSG